MSETSSLWHGNTFHFKQIYLFLKNYLHFKWLQSFGIMFFKVGICLINNTFLIHCFKVQIPIWLNDSVWGLCNQNESMHYRKCSFHQAREYLCNSFCSNTFSLDKTQPLRSSRANFLGRSLSTTPAAKPYTSEPSNQIIEDYIKE